MIPCHPNMSKNARSLLMYAFFWCPATFTGFCCFHRFASSMALFLCCWYHRLLYAARFALLAKQYCETGVNEFHSARVPLKSVGGTGIEWYAMPRTCNSTGVFERVLDVWVRLYEASEKKKHSILFICNLNYQIFTYYRTGIRLLTIFTTISGILLLQRYLFVLSFFHILWV